LEKKKVDKAAPEKEQKDKGKKKKRKRSSSSSSSSSTDSSSSDESSSSSSSSSSESGSSSSTDGDSKKKKKKSRKKKKKADNKQQEDGDGDNKADQTQEKKKKKEREKKADLELKEQLWRREERPDAYKSRKKIASMSLSKYMKMKEQVMKERERLGIGGEVYVKDIKPKKKKFRQQSDDGAKKLHPARFLPLPREAAAAWWRKVPTSHTEIYRHLPLAEYGCEGVKEEVVVRMHNRKIPVQLKALCSDFKDLKQVQLAVAKFSTVQRYLHPADLGGNTILLVLLEASWGEGVCNDDKTKIKLVEVFFDECVNENCHRAVHRQPPLGYEQLRSRWLKAVGQVCPQIGLAAMGQHIAALSGVRKAGGGDRGGHRNASGTGVRDTSGTGNGINRQQKKPGGNGTGLDGRVPARHMGLPVCFGFNNKDGCRRLAPGSTATKCQDGSVTFAHVCNHYFLDRKVHCLQQHSRFGNH